MWRHKKVKQHEHNFKPVYKTVHHDAIGHYETVTVPAWNEKVQKRHQVCFVCGRDKTQDFIDSIKNKTYPDFDEETKKDGGYTVENGLIIVVTLLFIKKWELIQLI